MQGEHTSAWLIAPTIKWTVAVVASLWVNVPVSVQTLLILMGFDFLTGLLLAAGSGTLNAAIGARGLIKKTLILILIAAAHYIVKPLGLSFDIGAVLASAFAITEMISITENCARAGLPIPPVLLDALLKAKTITGNERRDIVALNLKQDKDGGVALDVKLSQKNDDSKLIKP